MNPLRAVLFALLILAALYLAGTAPAVMVGRIP